MTSKEEKKRPKPVMWQETWKESHDLGTTSGLEKLYPIIFQET